MENDRESQAGLTEPIRFGSKLNQLVLASSSPRRAEILRSAGWEFEIHSVEIDESPAVNEAAIQYVERLALEKAVAAAVTLPGKIVLGADTTVVLDGDILGKPCDGNEARRMLRSLSGRWHEVLTGVALVRRGEKTQQAVTHESTRVQFAEMSDDEINWYVTTGEPMGKAGAYAIQGRAALFIDKIEGDYWNVVGLPVSLVYRLINKF